MLQPVGRFDDRDNRRSGGGNNFRGGGFNRGSSGGFRRDRQMFSAVCSNCGKDCQIPFRPTNSKPVYCSERFEKMNGGRDGGRNEGRPRFSDRQPERVNNPDQNNKLLENISNKLDRLIALMEKGGSGNSVNVAKAPVAPVAETTEVKESVEEKAPEVKKAPKAKKAAVKKSSK